MRQKDWFWCGAALFALAVFIALQGVQEPLYSCVTGGLCAVVSVILFGCGLRADLQEKSAAESKRTEEKEKQRRLQAANLEQLQGMLETLTEEVQLTRKSIENEGQAQKEASAALFHYLKEWSDAQQKSYTAALDQIQPNITAVTEKIQVLHNTITNESQSHAKTICDALLEQHTALCKILEIQGKDSTNYYKFMVGQPWVELKGLSETLQSIADQASDISSAVNAMQSETKEQIKGALNKLKAESESLQEKLQYVCATLEKQGKESRDAMDHVMQSYSDVTAQDIEVLTALARDVRE